jgi:hypothetical protein
MMNLRWVLVVALSIVSPAPRADVISDWNRQANEALALERPGIAGNPIAMARTLAVMHIAMVDAIGACDPMFKPYLGALPGAAGASPQAAASSAARTVLVALHPAQSKAIEQYYAEALTAVADGDAKAAGLEIGRKAAQLLLAQREDDRTFDGADTYRPFTAPGVYVPTGLPVVSNVAVRKPFVLKSVSQFRPGPPPALTSALWARDFNETREWGAAQSPLRDASQTETARFWQQLGPPAWNQVARALSTTRPLPLAENARIFALLNAAVFDAYLAVFDAKYHYNFWRPITAIRNADRDNNDATQRDAGWSPLIDTPPHPEYPCAHCTADGAAAVILRSAFGSGAVPPFKVTYRGMPDVKREYTSLRQLQDEVSMARIWGGVHYRNSNEVGEALGADVGTYVLQTILVPAPSRAMPAERPGKQ